MLKQLLALTLAATPLLAGAAAQSLPPGFAEQVGPAIKLQCLSQVPKDPSLVKALGHAPASAKVEDFCECTSKTFLRAVSPDEVIDPVTSDAKTQAALKQKMQVKLASASQQCTPRLGKLAINKAAP